MEPILILIFIHLQRLIIWSFITFIFGIMVSLSFLFSREITLNTVKIIEFNIYYSFINKMKELNNSEILSNFEILLSPKEFPLLQIALITESDCVENVSKYYEQKFNLSICNKISFNKLNNKDLKIDTYRDNNILFDSKETYIFKKLDNKEAWLIARIDDYYKKNDINRFFEYIISMEDGLSWITSIKSFKVFLDKSKFIWTIIVPSSFLLYFVFTLYYLIQTRKLISLKLEKDKYLSEWNKLNLKTKELILEQYKIEEKLKNNDNFSVKDIKKFELANKKILQDIDIYTNEIKTIEEKLKKISEKLHNISKYVTSIEKEKILEHSLDKLENIDLLWKYQPSWKQRHEIEIKVALRDNFTPFTISQAFICFEKIIEKLVTKVDVQFQKNNLMEQINIVFENNLLPNKFKKDLHLIRKARNEWFHTGKEPNQETYNILLDILDKTDTKPLL